jgi:Protein of unknown function (DUF3011)
VKRTWPAFALALVVALGAPAVASAQQINCESKNYQQEFCATGPIASAWMVAQRSQSPCIQGQTWGFQNNGIWVSQGCAADFAFQVAAAPPPVVAQNRPGGIRVVCESRNYQQQYCPTGQQITGAWVVDQRSSAPCIQGQTWGYQNGDIWVTQGCAAEFGVQGYNAPIIAPPVSGNIVCQSQNYAQNYCPIGQFFTRAWLVAQRSRAPCQQGRSWGYDRNGIWVTQGCEGEFAFD